MKYVVLNRGDELSLQITSDFHELARKKGLVLDQEHPDLVISIGGDGTMLHAFHSFNHMLDQIAFVGVHTGHLGFYADWKADEIEELIDHMARSREHMNQSIVEYPLAEIHIHTQKETQTYLALNEFTLRGVEATLVAKLHINDELFEMFRGDGICISTPSGSTAYNKSLGGALIHPSLETIQIAEMASINNRVYRTLGSSMILPQHHYCDIYPMSKQKLQITIDHLRIERDDILSIRSMVAKQTVRFSRYRPYPFWSRVRSAFIGHSLS